MKQVDPAAKPENQGAVLNPPEPPRPNPGWGQEPAGLKASFRCPGAGGAWVGRAAGVGGGALTAAGQFVKDLPEQALPPALDRRSHTQTKLARAESRGPSWPRREGAGSPSNAVVIQAHSLALQTEG